MGITITEASYNTTLAIVLAGVAPLIWSPLANVYGRRPVYIFSSIIGIAAGAGSAVATKWGNLLVARCFVGEENLVLCPVFQARTRQLEGDVAEAASVVESDLDILQYNPES